MKKSSRRSKYNFFSGNILLATAIFLGSLLLTIVASFSTNHEIERQANAEFTMFSTDIKNRIITRLNSHAQLLQNCASFLSVSDTVTRNDWKLFIEKSKVGNNLPGFQGIGFTVIVPKIQLLQHIMQIRNEGYSDYNIRPSGERDFYTSVIYLEPLTGKNLKVLGFDPYTEPVRRNGMIHACENNITSLSGKVTLVQDDDKNVQTGIIMNAPVYRKGMPLNTVSDRRKAIAGWVYSAYFMNDLMKGILGSWDTINNKKIRLQIFDGDSISSQSILFDSEKSDSSFKNATAIRKFVLPVEFNKKKWTLIFSQQKETLFFFQSKAFVVLISGILISFLLFALVLSLLHTKRRAEKLAEKLTSDLWDKNKEYEKLNNELRKTNKELASSEEELRATNEKLIVTSVALTESNEAMQIAMHKSVENEHRFFTLFEQAAVGVAIINTETGKFIQLNKKYCEICGYNHAEMQELDFMKITHPDDLQEDIQNMQKLKNGEYKEFSMDKRYFRKDNSLVWVRLSVSSLERINNVLKTHIAVVEDISDRKYFEMELKQAKEKAEESDRLKTAFLHNMSHEIRTPMNAICGFSGMLSKPGLSDEKRSNFVSIIQNSSHQLLSIVTDILAISSLETKQEKINLQPVCVNNLIVDLISIFKPQAQNQNISLYAKQYLTDKQSEVYTDKTKITQILTNLLTNAFKFTHQGFIEFGYILKTNIDTIEMEFFVKDSGIGIKPEFHEKIFERFSQADKTIHINYGGTGLGLSISKGFVELLGGKIGVQSEPEKGSIFYFTIPYNPVNENVFDNLTIQQFIHRPIILVAEDEEYSFLFMEELLNEMELNVVHARDGQQAVEIFNSNPKIELIFMDLKMPVMDGYEAAKIIKTLNPDIPIIAQSAYSMEYDRINFDNIFDSYVEKPISETDLKQLVLRHIDIKK